MLEKLSIIMEIIAAGLLAIHFLMKRKTHTTIDNWLLTRLSRKITPRGRLRPGVMVIVGILTFIVMLSIAIWGFVKDYQGKAWPTENLIISYVFFIAAAIGGILTITVILWIHNKYRFTDYNPINLVIILSVIISLACLLIASLLAANSVRIVSFLLTYSFTTLVIALWFGAMPYAQKYLTIRSGVLVRFGFIIFIAAKLIQLKLLN